MAPLIEQRSEKIVPGVAVAIERFRNGAATLYPLRSSPLGLAPVVNWAMLGFDAPGFWRQISPRRRAA
jgi:hypothetical protein